MAVQQISRSLGAAILRAAKNPRMPAADLLVLADMADREGAVATGKALRQRAGGGKKSASGLVETAPKTSPLPGTDPGDWEKFSSALKSNMAPDAAERGRVGSYAISMRRLADLGIVKNAKKVPVPGDSRKDTWRADWTGTTQQKFLGDEGLQQEVLARSLRDYADQIRNKYSAAIGKPLGDDVVTLSGLLGVAHVAGLRGLESWLRSGDERQKFSGTTKVFEATNGIF